METVIAKGPHDEKENFVTVVSVGASENAQSTLVKSDSPLDTLNNKSSAYVTVLTIGDDDEECVLNNKDVIEEVLVYRLPGERLGFGLKFEGGTKANEFVKRLFIQSCAPDSPASRVQSSWGKLSEGDEVLEIDCMPVNTMTRIDCVRCLKDSNVVIKLLVRHFQAEIKQKNDLNKTRSVEDLPQVVSAEKKRTPPPPPPVPPRKIPKKYYNKNNVMINNAHAVNNASNETNSSRQINSEITVSVNKSKKFQSPRSSGRSSYSPDIPRRDRRFSDGSLGPPDAEVYVDLFSQESTQSLSESDDTGSSISTVVDRFSSFPTTTASSLAGSLPSTPTSIQKHLDFSHLLNAYEDDEFSMVLNRNTSKQVINVTRNPEAYKHEKVEEKQMTGEDGVPLQPPSCFQDAPLSYGNEDMRIETKSNATDICEYSIVQNSMNNYSNEKPVAKTATIEEKVFKKPPVPPRSRDSINAHKMNGCKDIQNIHDENMNISNLPRLVDFVPKSTVRENFESHVEIINTFLENERRDTSYFKNEPVDDIDSNGLHDDYNNDIDVFSSKWGLSPQLATIGEVEEEGNSESLRTPLNSTPIVIVENADNENSDEAEVPLVCQSDLSKDAAVISNKGINGKMETLSSDSRQPPDGHEFPDYEEGNLDLGHNKFGRDSYVDVDERTSGLIKIYKSVECVNSSQNKSSFNNFSSVPIQNKSVLNKINSVSNSDLSSINSKDPYDSSDEVTLRRTGLEPKLHTRSQSLIDMSSISKQKGDRWTLLAEQRKKGLSKLKGLVIPEHVSESETTPAVNIPEIISHTTPSFVLETKINSNHTLQYQSTETEPVALPLTSPPWSSETNNANTIPKYSPAFKRKSLQVYTPLKNNKKEEPDTHHLTTAINKTPVKSVSNEKNSNNSATTINKKPETEEFRLDHLSDAPKSLESITSPTRSDCSFDYITNKYSNNNNRSEVNASVRTLKESPNYVSRLHKDLGKSEDESDNDSAVSSSQSSYISRCSPPPSPTRSCEMLDYDSNLRSKTEDGVQCRLLKPASVEAINRKNILASAKCRSGRDLKVGSPIIQRKYDDDDSLNTSSIETDNSISNHSSASSPSTPSKLETECNSIECPALPKEKKSVNCEESTTSKQQQQQQQPMVNGIEEKKQSDVVPTAKKVELHTPLVTLRPVAQRRNSTDIKDSKTLLKNDVPRTSSLLSKNKKSMSVTDLRKSFEKFGATPPPLPNNINILPKDTKTKIETKPKTVQKSLPDNKAKSSENLAKLETLKTKPNSTQKPVEQEKEAKECVFSSGPNRRKVVLSPEFVGGSVGITLAGGTDYETKEITVHRIRYGSAAYNDGTLKKGDKIISINGKVTAGLTHAESVEMLKEPVAKFVLMVEEGKEETVTTPKRKSFIYDSPEPKNTTPVTPTVKNVTNVISIIKDGGGLGFSIEGGKDSLQGDLPLRVKKIFQGGSAEKDGKLLVGDELLAINDVTLVNMSRIEAWSLMKKLPDGNVSIHIHR